MQALKLLIEPHTAFGTPLVGDTLFGQICWGIAEQYGEAKLEQCLQGYTDGQPFLVASDAFPQNCLPLPTLPSAYWTADEKNDRKALKKRIWLPENTLQTASRNWQQQAKSDADLAAEHKNTSNSDPVPLRSTHSQSHNSINRQTGTTGEAGFAPYESEQIWYAPGSIWQIFLLLDENRLSRSELHTVVENIGKTGYGRDASVGLGKYRLKSLADTDLFARHADGNACFTLAPSCPQGQGFDNAHSYYNTLTRFGRHGNIQATAGQPFKHPVLMAQTSAVFFGERHGKPYIGQGISGISKSLPATVQQGYAPVIAFTLETNVFTTDKEFA